MKENGKVYARTVDITGDIKIEGEYAEGEVTIIDRKEPDPGTITMRQETIDGEIYLGEGETPRNIYIEVNNGIDEENRLRT